MNEQKMGGAALALLEAQRLLYRALNRWLDIAEPLFGCSEWDCIFGNDGNPVAPNCACARNGDLSPERLVAISRVLAYARTVSDVALGHTQRPGGPDFVSLVSAERAVETSTTDARPPNNQAD